MSIFHFSLALLLTFSYRITSFTNIMTFNKRRQINAASETQRRGAYTSKNGNKDYKVRLRWL